MYGIFPYIYHKNQPNVGIYTIHGYYGFVTKRVVCANQLVVRYVDKNGEPNPRMKRPCAMNFRPRSW